MARDYRSEYARRKARAQAQGTSVFKIRAAKYLVVHELGNEIRSATAEALRRGGKGFRQIAEIYDDELGNKAGRKRVNQALAESMQERMLTAYQENVLAHKVPSYRHGAGRFPGELLEALKSPTMAKGTAEAIKFVDYSMLNRKAKHWGRLNFGTEGTGEQRLDFPKEVARIRFGQGQQFVISVPGNRRAAFHTPEAPAKRGYFANGGEFHIGKNPDKDGITIRRTGKLSRGIGARRYIDAGLKALEDNFRAFYQEYIDDVTRKVQAKANEPRKG